MKNNETFLKKAESLRPKLYKQNLYAEGNSTRLKKGDSICLDFGKHIVGYVSFDLCHEGCHPDSPVLLRLQFAENPAELKEDPDEYHGWISSAWIQQETVHADVIPGRLSLPRRYSFRYVNIQVLEISDRFDLVVKGAECTAVSSADSSVLSPLESGDSLADSIYDVSCKTLHDCMQLVFEDGPKRDRRLWLGDLRIQALANYCSYKNMDLVKRCLYLFAGSTMDDSRISAGIFIEPEVEADDKILFDYSLLFCPALLDYYEASADADTLKELWPSAWRQIELSQKNFDETDTVKDCDSLGWCFVDWNLSLNKQASAQGLYIYSALAAKKIAGILGDEERLSWLSADIESKKEAAVREFYDDKLGLFVSGPQRQISWASQIWMVLGGVDRDGHTLENITKADAVAIVSPYLKHHYVQALIDTGRKEEARKVIKEYWGGMRKAGADTFWELYNPEDPKESPYGGTIVNSYCHAWSCGPAWFLKKYFSK